MPVPGSTRPHPARVYNLLAGGADWHDADRDLAERLTGPGGGYPGLRRLVRENRAFTARAVTWAAQRGITRFLVPGCGLPVPPAVHESARAVRPEASAVYADRDPLVVSHARRMAGPGVAVVAGDVADPASVMADPAVRELAAGPVCVILTSVLHLMGAEQAREVTAGFTGPLPAGSVLVLSVPRYEDGALHERLAAMYEAAGMRLRNHSRQDVESFFAGTDLVRPVMNVRLWPDQPPGLQRTAVMAGGVAVKG